ncbi:MAG: amino acid adenylation domain-containing protein, partial [Acidobacteriota bacterium]|nr:amino acid adenylation domain-containing protein [Acidobacteriota bacterium]
VFLQFAPISFDASTLEIWGSLLNGARLAIVPPGPTSLDELAAAVEFHRVTTLFLTTGLFNQMADGPLSKLRSVRQLLTGGDVFSRSHGERVLTELPDCRLINLYGPTENTTVTSYFPIDREKFPAGNVPIGRPIANTRVYLLDDQLRPCPPGSAGELYIAGDGLALGYWRRPELTEQKFIPSPFPAVEPGRLYRSGDLGRCLPDGNIEFLGRVDRQVKIRGYRIEPDEIETVIASHPRIRQSVVVAVGAGGDKHLVAYVVADGLLRTSEPRHEGRAAKGEAGEGVPAEPPAVLHGRLVPEVRRFLQSRLPEYMVPSSFVVLDSLPLDRNGKIDRRSLPAVSNEREVETPFLPPRTPVEEMLCEIWKELLGLEVVGIDDNFFELGGHSLIANQLLSRIWTGFGIEIPLPRFFRSPTVREIAERLSGAERRESLDAVSIRPVPRSGDLPLSLSQENVWFLQELDPDNRAYQFQPTLRFHGELDEVALERSLAEVLRRHEILRTTFPSVEGAPVQRIHASLSTPLTVVDLQEVAESARHGELRRRIDEEVQRTFDLTKLPLVRWTLYRLGPQERVLQHVEHHIVHDGWSFNVFLRELATLYRAFQDHEPSPLPEPEIQFGDYAVFQRRWMETGEARVRRAYWTEKLAATPAALEIPSDRPRKAVQTFRGAVRVVELPIDLAEALRALSRREGCTLFMTMLAAFATLLYRYSGREDFCIGSGVANRRWLETEGLMGMFVNMVALRMDLGGEPTFTDLLRRVRDVTLEGNANQDYPFAAVVDAVQPERRLSHPPICQVLFSFHDSPLAELDFGGLQLDLQEFVSNGSAKFDLNIICVPRSEQRIGRKSKAPASGITLAWEYKTDLFDESTIGRMLGHFETLLRAVVSDADRPVSLLPMLTPAEKHQILAGFSDPERGSSRTETVTELFEEQARRTPDAVAVVFGRERVSYAQLNERANRLAWHLRKRGVGPEALVGLCVERSVQMVVGLLGILKAGGAYVPLDPEYPRQRLEFMLEDTAARVVLTQQSLLERLPNGSFERVRLDADWAEIEKESAENPESHATSENLAYVIYTSGSTGTPKGVAIEHHSTVALLAWAKETFSAGELAGVLASTSICFDLSVFEIFTPLAWGGTVILSEDVLHFPELPAAQEVTLVNTIPSAMAQLIRMGALPASVGTVNLAGEPLAPSLVREILQSRTVRRVFDLYGPTEDTTYSTCARRTAEAPATIGRPISNKRVYVLDAHLQPVPVGIPGDLYVAGAGVARGYLN